MVQTSICYISLQIGSCGLPLDSDQVDRGVHIGIWGPAKDEIARCFDYLGSCVHIVILGPGSRIDVMNTCSFLKVGKIDAGVNKLKAVEAGFDHRDVMTRRKKGYD